MSLAKNHDTSTPWAQVDTLRQDGRLITFQGSSALSAISIYTHILILWLLRRDQSMLIVLSASVPLMMATYQAAPFRRAITTYSPG